MLGTTQECHCEASWPKQSRLVELNDRLLRNRDCFASLAMTLKLRAIASLKKGTQNPDILLFKGS
jgi:hypothetical protein